MGQFWDLINLDKRSYIALGKLGAFFDAWNWNTLAINLTMPVFQALPPLKNGRMRAAKWVVGMDSSLGRLQLAIELINMIFKEIDNFDDAIMLGLTHDTLMAIGWEHIRALLVRDSAPWAGTRIIIAGDYGKSVPEGLILEEEKEEWDRLCLEQGGRELEDLSLNEFFIYVLEATSPEDRKDHERRMGLSPEERQLVHKITEERYQWEKGWVLMNQTKKVYVTSKAASKILPSMEATDARCFGRLIFSRICWSSSSERRSLPNFIADLHRGLWAGDRFVIVTMDGFEAMSSEKGWKDVRVEAAEWLRGLVLALDEGW